MFIVSASSGQNPQFWANFDFWGLPYRPPITDESHIWCDTADPQHTFTYQNLSRSVYSIALWRRKTPIFAVFFGLRHLVMSTVGGNLRKWNTGAQLQTYPYPTASKSFLYFNIFMVKSGAQTDVQKRDVTSVTEKA